MRAHELHVKFPEHYNFEINIYFQTAKNYFNDRFLCCDVKDEHNTARYKIRHLDIVNRFELFISGGLLSGGEDRKQGSSLEQAGRYFFHEVNAMLADKFIEPNPS